MPATEAPTMDEIQLKKAVESLLFITDHPLNIGALCKITGVKDEARVGEAIAQIKREMEENESPVQLLEVADGYQMATRASYAPYVRKLFSDRLAMRLSTAALETLAIIAYKQPLTRAEIEEIRGVEVIAALETLLEKRLVKVVGRKETVGRPLMYGTTADFLRHFGLQSLEALPPIEKFGEAAAAAEAASQQTQQPDTAPQAWESAQEASAVVVPPEPQAEPLPEPRNIWGDETPSTESPQEEK